MIPRRNLGINGIEVSILGLSSAAMCGQVPDRERADVRESTAAVHQALDCGINLIETSPEYGAGLSEELVGKAVQGRRDEVRIVSKLVLPAVDDVGRDQAFFRRAVEAQCTASLRRLRSGMIDLYAWHLPSPTAPLNDVLQVLNDLKQQGKIGAVGLSHVSLATLAKAVGLGPIDFVECVLSVIRRRAVEDFLPFCRKREISVLACGVLHRGLAAGGYSQESRLTGLRRFDPEFFGSRYQTNLALVQELGRIATHLGKSAAQLAINWACGVPGVTSVVFGANRPSQVVENMGGIGWSPPSYALESLRRAFESHESGL